MLVQPRAPQRAANAPSGPAELGLSRELGILGSLPWEKSAGTAAWDGAKPCFRTQGLERERAWFTFPVTFSRSGFTVCVTKSHVCFQQVPTFISLLRETP